MVLVTFFSTDIHHLLRSPKDHLDSTYVIECVTQVETHLHGVQHRMVTLAQTVFFAQEVKIFVSTLMKSIKWILHMGVQGISRIHVPINLFVETFVRRIHKVSFLGERHLVSVSHDHMAQTAHLVIHHQSQNVVSSVAVCKGLAGLLSMIVCHVWIVPAQKKIKCAT